MRDLVLVRACERDLPGARVVLEESLAIAQTLGDGPHRQWQSGCSVSAFLTWPGTPYTLSSMQRRPGAAKILAQVS
jgi:hypothetical protein